MSVSGFRGSARTADQCVYTTGTLTEYVVLFEENGQFKMAGFSK
jgi:hypothetical protein